MPPATASSPSPHSEVLFLSSGYTQLAQGFLELSSGIVENLISHVKFAVVTTAYYLCCLM
jgi:hypothetical protein